MNYFGYDIHQDFTIWKDGKQMFTAIKCFSVSDCELLIDSYLMAQDITEKAVLRLPGLSNIEIKELLND